MITLEKALVGQKPAWVVLIGNDNATPAVSVAALSYFFFDE